MDVLRYLETRGYKTVTNRREITMPDVYGFILTACVEYARETGKTWCLTGTELRKVFNPEYPGAFTGARRNLVATGFLTRSKDGKGRYVWTPTLIPATRSNSKTNYPVGKFTTKTVRPKHGFIVRSHTSPAKDADYKVTLTLHGMDTILNHQPVTYSVTEDVLPTEEEMLLPEISMLGFLIDVINVNTEHLCNATHVPQQDLCDYMSGKLRLDAASDTCDRLYRYLKEADVHNFMAGVEKEALKGLPAEYKRVTQFEADEKRFITKHYIPTFFKDFISTTHDWQNAVRNALVPGTGGEAPAIPGNKRNVIKSLKDLPHIVRVEHTALAASGPKTPEKKVDASTDESLYTAVLNSNLDAETIVSLLKKLSK